MGKCQAGDCGISCEGECICFASTENPSDCDCSCDGPILVAIALRNYAAYPNALIDVHAVDMPLIRVAEWFEDLFPEQILVPASKVHTRININVKATKVADFIKDIGLVPRSEPLVGRQEANS
jgi:hypothetical protein